MTQRTLRIPGTLKHANEEQTDASLQEKAREHADRHPGVRFLADILRLLHGPIAPLRNASAFYSAFAPREVMDALAERPDLRVKIVKAMTGSPAALLRRLSPEALASQIDLLAIEDLPEAERTVRAEADRALSVYDLYVKYLDPVDIATYLPAQAIWMYESHDDWWKWEPSAGSRALMAAELKAVRRHAILTDAEVLDLLGDETLERYLPLAVRTGLRKAARRAAAERRPFTDTDMLDAVGAGGGTRDLIDEMVECVPLPQLRDVMVHAGRMLGVTVPDDNEEPTQVTAGAQSRDATPVPVPIGSRVGPRATPALAKTAAPVLGKKNDRGATAKAVPPPPPAKGGRPPIPAEAEGPPQPDDDFALFEEVSGRVV